MGPVDQVGGLHTVNFNLALNFTNCGTYFCKKALQVEMQCHRVTCCTPDRHGLCQWVLSENTVVGPSFEQPGLCACASLHLTIDGSHQRLYYSQWHWLAQH
jgi:hypothetical protein